MSDRRVSSSADVRPRHSVAAHGTPLSALHGMLGSLERQTDPKRLNEILNHPEIYPWVADSSRGPIDISGVLALPAVIALLGTKGGFMFTLVHPGLYEVHSQVLPEGRGRWGLLCAQAALHWIFTKTDAVEILTRCPHGNLPAHALARAVGGVYRFTNPRGWVKDGAPIPADIFSLTIQDWLMKAPGLVERGRWFHSRLADEFARAKVRDIAEHGEDEVHDRYVGAACEMLLAGNPAKAVAYYNRWACVSSYAPVAICGLNPLTINIGTAILEIDRDDFRLASARAVH